MSEIPKIKLNIEQSLPPGDETGYIPEYFKEMVQTARTMRDELLAKAAKQELLRQSRKGETGRLVQAITARANASNTPIDFKQIKNINENLGEAEEKGYWILGRKNLKAITTTTIHVGYGETAEQYTYGWYGYLLTQTGTLHKVSTVELVSEDELNRPNLNVTSFEDFDPFTLQDEDSFRAKEIRNDIQVFVIRNNINL